jgi:hypothetical protein
LLVLREREKTRRGGKEKEKERERDRQVRGIPFLLFLKEKKEIKATDARVGTATSSNFLGSLPMLVHNSRRGERKER